MRFHNFSTRCTMGEVSIAADSPSAETPMAVNRLFIAHLLLWLTMTAVVLAFERQQTAEPTIFPASEPALSQLRAKWKLSRAISLLAAPATGAGLAAVCLAFWRAFDRRPPFPTQPGYWLLMVIAAQFAARFVFYALWWINSLGGWSGPIELAACGAFMVPTAAALIAAVKSTQRRWGLSFALLAAAFCGYAMGFLAIYIRQHHIGQYWTMLGLSLGRLIPAAGAVTNACAILLLAAYSCSLASAARDLWLKERRDIFHWTGCVAILLVAMQGVASRLIWST